ncbi:glycosyltransferase family 2 protein [Roseateles sp. NT4]|uniref:glycosyltransferase family 2 protein n=1 Tax=Roseateles sp. NT4 TaxID=3453715 RepID=UPI003EEA781D
MQTTAQPSPGAQPAVSVVVVTYNGAPWVRRCLGSLADSGAEVIVVDNASSDDTCAIVSAEFPSVVLIRNGSNDGFGRGNNIGIRHALARGARYVFLLNQDAYVLPQSMAELTAFMDAHPHIGVVSPLHCSPDAEHVDQRTLRGYLQRHLPGYLADACMGRSQAYYETFGVNAAAWFVRAEVWRQAGGFDPLFFMYGEDDDLLHRWQHQRIVFALLPASRIVHLRESVKGPRPSWVGEILQLARRRRALLLNEVKRPGFSALHMLATLLSQGFVAPVAEALVSRDGKGYLASVVAGWQLLLRWPQLRRHARLTATTGPHFLADEVPHG